MPTAGMAEIILAKHRNGAVCDVNLRFLKEQARFADVEDSMLPPAQAAESQQAYDDYASGSNSQPGTSGLGAAMGGRVRRQPLDEDRRRSAFLAMFVRTFAGAVAGIDAVAVTVEVNIAGGGLGSVPRGTARQCREGERTAHPGGVRELGRADVGQEGGREPRSGRPAQGGVGFRPADRRGNPRGDGPHRRRGGRRDDVRRRTVARRLAQTRAGRAARCGPGAFGGAAAGGAAGGKRGGGRGCRRHRGDRRHDACARSSDT